MVDEDVFDHLSFMQQRLLEDAFRYVHPWRIIAAAVAGARNAVVGKGYKPLMQTETNPFDKRAATARMKEAFLCTVVTGSGNAGQST